MDITRAFTYLIHYGFIQQSLVQSQVQDSCFGLKIQEWHSGLLVSLITFLEYLVIRWGWTWLMSDPLAWRKKYPHITEKIDELEDRIQDLEIDAHPPVAPGGTTELKNLISAIEARLSKLEKKK